MSGSLADLYWCPHKECRHLGECRRCKAEYIENVPWLKAEEEKEETDDG